MALWTNHSVKEAIQGIHHGPAFKAEGVALHTGNVRPGDLFIALKGAQSDGHLHLKQAVEKGAVAAIVSDLSAVKELDIPYVLVSDTHKALLDLARFNRDRLKNTKVIGVTGSVGKTTTREMIRHMLLSFGSVFASQRNYNTLEGVAIDLARCPVDADYAVIEIAMSRSGEIAPTARLAKLDVALVTLVAENHVEAFPSLAAIAEEKATIFSGLKAGGIGIVNHDSEYFDVIQKRFQAGQNGPFLTYGHHEKADGVVVSSEPNEEGQTVTVRFGASSVSFDLKEKGKHFQVNALGALAVLKALGLDVQKGAQRLHLYEAYEGRGACREITLFKEGEPLPLTVLDETYNAGYTSVKAALRRAREIAGDRRLVFVMGDILGISEPEKWHQKLLPVMEEVNLNKYFACGPQTEKILSQLREEQKGVWKAESTDLIPYVLDELQEEDVVLLKGSRAMKVDVVRDALYERAQQEKNS